ncbi:MAG: response regulator [Sulfitobacter sp.]|uniref:response regulator n=1 Tax=Sulfitobacter sp. TaxID=1903071 RepID=UPI003B5D6AFF
MSAADQYLAGLKVLIVEDEPFIALDLAFGVEDAGGIPLGPASSVAQALKLIEDALPDAAIVDVDLPDGKIGPVLAALRPMVPVVVHTGVGLPELLRKAHPELLVCTKPTAPSELARRLSAEISQHSQGEES